MSIATEHNHVYQHIFEYLFWAKMNHIIFYFVHLNEYQYFIPIIQLYRYSKYVWENIANWKTDGLRIPTTEIQCLKHTLLEATIVYAGLNNSGDRSGTLIVSVLRRASETGRR